MKTWDEKLSGLSAKLADLSAKAATASEDAKAYRELRKEVIEDKISAAKGNVAAMKEAARLAGEEQEGKLRSALLKAQMTVRARHEDLKEARDKRRMENFVDSEILYILDCYDSAMFLIAEAELSILQVAGAMREYKERFGDGAGE